MSTEVRREVYSQIGGHPALDLINTVEWRLNTGRFADDLIDYEDLVRWGGQVGLVSEAEASVLREAASVAPADAAKEFSRSRSLRDALYATLFAAGDPGVVAREYADTVGSGRLDLVGDRWEWEVLVDLALPRRRIALEAFDLLTRADLSTLGQCQDADCGWVFLDTSPRQNRRWCVAADCGNRNRAREFYRRARAS